MDFYKVINSVLDGWPAKLLAAGVITIVIHHATLLLLFSLLVILDTVTRWIAIAYDYTGRTGLIDAIKGIPAAHRARAISSAEMRRGFAEKLISYIILVFGGAIVDHETGTAVFANMIISYLSATELLSIIENLNDAGVSCLTGLVTIIRRKAGMDPRPPRQEGEQNNGRRNNP